MQFDPVFSCEKRGVMFPLQRVVERIKWAHINNVFTEETGPENQMWLIFLVLSSSLSLPSSSPSQCLLFWASVPGFTFSSPSSSHLVLLIHSYFHSLDNIYEPPTMFWHSKDTKRAEVWSCWQSVCRLSGEVRHLLFFQRQVLPSLRPHSPLLPVWLF